MSNEQDDRSIGKLNQWCVGEEPSNWDVSFGAKLTEQLRRWLGLRTHRPTGSSLPPAPHNTLSKAA